MNFKDIEYKLIKYDEGGYIPESSYRKLTYEIMVKVQRSWFETLLKKVIKIIILSAFLLILAIIAYAIYFRMLT